MDSKQIEILKQINVGLKEELSYCKTLLRKSENKQIEIFTSVVYKEMCAKENTLYFTDEERKRFFENIALHVEKLLLVVKKLNK